MGTRPPETSREVVFLFTTFPVLSETFLEREMEYFRRSGLSFRLVSLWGGARSWRDRPVERFGLGRALLAPFCALYWAWRRPGKIAQMLGWIFPRKSGQLNWGENLLGLAYAAYTARRWERESPLEFHAVWASAPAMAGLALHQLTGVPWSFAGHAYDLFEHGGDGWLEEKFASARWIRSSTRQGIERMRELGAPEARLRLIRRGLVELPRRRTPADWPERPSFLTVGRMVAKMGHAQQIPFFRNLKDRGIPFSATWIGDGPLRPDLERALLENGLSGDITLSGARPHAEVEEAYTRHDFLLFTGVVDPQGDRAGLPNVIPEAMARGLLVFTTNAGAVGEAVSHLKNGFILGETADPDVFCDLWQQDLDLAAIAFEARRWVEDHYSLENNLRPLLDAWQNATFPA